ncbi:MAG: rod shape-determining protein MreD [Coriobacteriia bacterium]|nr:rod shape-determining protein MreD [Coriobacteriia bacterium]
MNRILPTAIALIAAAILQIAVAPYMSIFGVVPNVIFLVVVTLALVEGPVAGCTAGFVGGLLFDLLGNSVVGPYALVFCVVGYVAGLLQANMFAEGWLLPVTVVGLAGLGAEITHGVILSVLPAGAPFWGTMWRVMLPGALYNTALAVLVYPWLARLLRRDSSMKSFRRLA